MNTATLPLFAAEWVEWLRATYPDAEPAALAAAGLVAVRAEEGHVCVPLAQEAGGRWMGVEWPALPAWRERLLASGFVASQAATSPLVLDGDDLYLARLWQDECQLAEALLARAQPGPDSPARVRAVLGKAVANAGDRDQHLAIATALLNRLTLIVGGPGTGKTTTVAKVLAARAALQPDCRIVLAAPTGKAAARMADALNNAKGRLGLDMLTLAALPEQAWTLHRLLGYRPDSATPRHGPDNPLTLDLLVVDEASMMDLALFARLMAALPPEASLILLGDDAQLASVEAGSVFADLAGLPGPTTVGAARLAEAAGGSVTPMAEASPLGDGIARLHTSRRFDANSGVGALAKLTRAGDMAGVMTLLGEGRPDVHWQAGLLRQCLREFTTQLAQQLTGYRQAVASRDVAAAWQAFQRLCILSPLREGPAGVDYLNRLIETQIMGQEPKRKPFYAGRPVIVRANAPTLGLANGDVGLTLVGKEGLQVHFPTADGWRVYAPSRLPRHDTAFVLTVHQSQGSEFDAVWLILPDEDAAVLDRSLVYTAVTRARQRVVLWGSAVTLDKAVGRVTQRASGLAKRLAPSAGKSPAS